MLMRAKVFASMLSAAVVAACGDDGTGVSGDLLTEAEATELAGAIFMSTVASALDADPAPVMGGPAMAPYSYSKEVDFTAACPLGGSVGVSASLHVEGDSESEAGSAQISMTLVHAGCMVESPAEVFFTLDGAPDVTASLAAVNDGEGNLTLAGEIEGSVGWAKEGRSGTCPLAVTFGGAWSVGEPTAQFSGSGEVCGHSVEDAGSVD
jgi:hypothetical protein